MLINRNTDWHAYEVNRMKSTQSAGTLIALHLHFRIISISHFNVTAIKFDVFEDNFEIIAIRIYYCWCARACVYAEDILIGFMQKRWQNHNRKKQLKDHFNMFSVERCE